MIGGKVLDPSSLAAYVRGDLAMASWVHIAPSFPLTLAVSDLVIHEVRNVLPEGSEQLAQLMDSPVVVRFSVTAATGRDVVDRLDQVGVFDATAGHVVHLAETRDWPVLSADPDRLRRLAPSLDIDVI